MSPVPPHLRASLKLPKQKKSYMKPCMVDPLSIVHVVSQCSHVISELGGLDIEAQHCVAEHDADKVFLTPLSGATSINSDTITCKTKLTHGTYLYMFYFVFLFSLC